MSNFNVNLESITENASRLGARIQETFSERTRDLAARGSNALFLDAPEDKLREVRKQLDAGSDREKVDAMKRLIALISKGRNVSEYFAHVVKNVASPNLEVRKLVYIYLLRYAEQEPDLALLSINTFQKDLNDPNPLIRAMALRVLSGIKVPMIGSIVVLAIRKCAADPSPYVRKAAAFAIPKCYSLDESHLPELIGIIISLLKDQSPLSIGNTAVAFEMVCSTRLDLLHSHFRRLCRTLADVDEWGQVNLLGLLTRYVRTMLLKPSDSGESTDPDLQLLLSCSEPLFMSRNPAVVLSVASAFFYVGPSSQLPKIVAPILRIMQSSREVERVVLSYLLVICQAYSNLFAPYYSRLLVRADDSTAVKTMKMRLLQLFVTPENHQAILREFIDYSEDVDDKLVADSITAIGRIALSIPSSSQQCLTALMGFIKSRHDVVVSNAVLVLKSLVQSQAVSGDSSQSSLSIVSKLAQRVDEFHHPQAKACVIWLTGQYAEQVSGSAAPGTPAGIAPWAPDVLRQTTKTFGAETALVKLQIITLAAKLVVLDPSHNTLVLLSRYSLSLARYDTDYDVRDRARMLSSLLRGVVPDITEANESGELSGVVLRREQVRVVLFDGKLAASLHDAKATSWDDNHALLSSLSVVTGREMHGERILPDWLEQGVEPSLRESPDDAPRRAVPTAISLSAPLAVDSARGTPIVLTPANGSPAVGSAKGAWTDLDKFYDDSDDGDDGDDNENEDEEEEAESESEEEEEEEEEGTGSEAVESSDGEEAEEEEQQPRSGTHQSSYA